MASYHLVTRWVFQAPVERLWEKIGDVEAWPSWLPHDVWQATVRRSGPSLGIGTVADCRVRGFLPYSLRFSTEVTAFEPPVLVEVKAAGDLVGEGRIVLEPQDRGTAVTIHWDVATTHPLLNAISRLPFTRTMMEKNHSYVMGRVYRALRSQVESGEGPA